MDTNRRLGVRLPLALLAPGAATFLAWWALLGTDADDRYSVPQVAGLVLLLLVIGVAAGWLVRRGLVVAAAGSAVVGISAACWLGWSDDETGLFVVGWLMVTVAAVPVAALLIGLTHAIRDSARQRPASR